MSHLNSVRVPAAIIVTALLVIILVSSSHTTYTLAPAPRPAAGLNSPASCEGWLVTVAREAVPRRACPWPHRARQARKRRSWTQQDWAQLDQTPQ